MTDITQLLGKDADSFLQHCCVIIPSDQLYLSGHDYVDRIMVDNSQSSAVLRNMQTLYNIRRLAGTGYLSILSVDQEVKHSTGASFAANPLYFDPKSIVELAVEAGCNCVASAYSVLAFVSRHYAYRVLFFVRINHDETLSYPNTSDQTLYVSVEQAFNMDAAAVGITTYSGSGESRRQTEETLAAFERTHELGMVIVLWAYLYNSASKKGSVDYHISTGLTRQANHLAAAIGMDIARQRMVENNGGYKAVNFGYTGGRVYTKSTGGNPIDLVRYQLASYYMGCVGLISSGGVAGGNTDLGDAVHAAVTNRRAGGMGLTLGRKAFKKAMADDVELTNVVQDVYPDNEVTIA